jgi:hypothetical protein
MHMTCQLAAPDKASAAQTPAGYKKADQAHVMAAPDARVRGRQGSGALLRRHGTTTEQMATSRGFVPDTGGPLLQSKW